MREALVGSLAAAGLLLGARSAIGAGPEAGRTYANPVLVDTHAIRRAGPAPYHGTLGIGDPAVIRHDGRYYLYPTGDNASYDVYLSDDLVHWTKGPKVFRSGERGVWAPDVFFDQRDRTFYLYYTVDRRIGVAASDRPDGTFADRGSLVAAAIDAHLFRDDDGALYLYYARYPDFAIFVQAMRSPLAKKDEPPVELLAPTEAWERRDVPVTEAPWVLKRAGTYYLLYSAGSADSEHYAIGYATAKDARGPFTKHRGNPIVREGGGIFGPGHVAVVADGAGDLWLVYHQQKDATRGWNRIICIDRLRFDADGTLRATPTRGTPLPAPAALARTGRAAP
ncbi:MAG TPA: glycoside hydrolase family 43 protein [bacterium]